MLIIFKAPVGCFHNNGNPPADGLDLTMKGTLNVMVDYCYIPLGTYFKLGAQAGFLSNFGKSPYLRFWRS